MASIQIKNLQPAGSNLFNDSESYLNELTESELVASHGGSDPFLVGLTIGITVTIVTKL